MVKKGLVSICLSIAENMNVGGIKEGGIKWLYCMYNYNYNLVHTQK